MASIGRARLGLPGTTPTSRLLPMRLLTAGLSILTLLQLVSAVRGNTPPTLSMPRDWSVQESEPIGSVVARISSHDADGDPVFYRIDKPSLGEDGSSLFEIDPDGVVRLAKSVKGLSQSNLYVSVIATDGEITTRTDARVVVGAPKGKSTHGGLFAALNPGAPPISVPRPFDNLRHRQRLQGRFPHVNIPAEPTGSPPLLKLPSPAIWRVQSAAGVNSVVAVVDAIDITDDSYFFTLRDEQGLIAIDPQTGEVTVKKPLTNQVGNHKVLVKVTNRHGTADGEVLFQVLQSPPPTEAPTTTPPPSPSTSGGQGGQGVHLSTTVRSVVRPTLIAIIKNGPTPPPSTSPPPPHPSVGGEHSGGVNGGLSILGVILIALGTSTSVLVGPILYYFCCRKSKHSGIDRKESSVKYDKKGLELTPASSAASSLSRQQAETALGQQSTALPQVLRFWERRASENKYVTSQAPSIVVPSRQVSTKDSSTSVLNEPSDEWEFPRHKLKVLGILGEGCFGQVWKYEATSLQGPEGEKTFVAVKTLKESAGAQERNDLHQELKVLKGLGKHPNVVSLLACCTEKEPILLVLEYMIHGKLQTYLRDRRSKQPYNNLHGSSSTLSPRDLTIFALQVAKGMDYLCTHGIVHRDLAARNVLVGEDKICKVADFGFARDVANNHVYERKSDGRLPIRWMAVESLFDNIFTSKTDVWSFGILLWEIVTLGSTPYPGMSAEEVMKKIKVGYRLEKPSYCKREVYNIMYYCWYEDPRERPTFKELIKLLEGLITSEVDYIELNQFPERCYYNIRPDPASGELL